jgi:hypothetical protein
MRLLTITTCAVLVYATATAVPRLSLAQDRSISLVVNPTTGASSIRNDTGSSISIDGYLLTSGGSVFNPAGWSTLASNPGAYPGWSQGPAAANRLGEANLLSSFSLAGGSSIALGTPYSPFAPSVIGQVEPGLEFEYRVAGVGSFQGDVVFSPQNNFVLIVNPATGAASLQNQSSFNLNVDGILIKSTNNVLNPDGWDPLAESVAGWTKGAAATNRLGEGNLVGSTPFGPAGAPVAIGSPINPAALTDETDLEFEYHIAGGDSMTGGVVFTASAGVAPLTGDYNGNGTVDTADYIVWRKNIGAGSLNNRGAGITGPVGPADYDFWRSTFGTNSGGSSGLIAATAATVPEPGAVTLLAAVATALAIIRRR